MISVCDLYRLHAYKYRIPILNEIQKWDTDSKITCILYLWKVGNWVPVRGCNTSLFNIFIGRAASGRRQRNAMCRYRYVGRLINFIRRRISIAKARRIYHLADSPDSPDAKLSNFESPISCVNNPWIPVITYIGGWVGTSIPKGLWNQGDIMDEITELYYRTARVCHQFINYVKVLCKVLQPTIHIW